GFNRGCGEQIGTSPEGAAEHSTSTRFSVIPSGLEAILRREPSVEIETLGLFSVVPPGLSFGCAFHDFDFLRHQAACLPKPQRRQAERIHQLVYLPLPPSHGFGGSSQRALSALGSRYAPSAGNRVLD